MNYLLSWLCEHIRYAHSKLSLKKIITIIESSIAEIDGTRKIEIPFENLTIVEIVSIDEERALCNSHEFNRVISLEYRDDLIEFGCYLVFKDGNEWRWASMKDVGGIRDAYMPALTVTQDAMKGGWKSKLKQEDYLIEIDNKSINNRPDLWGHRGLAREIAAFAQLPLISDDEFLAEIELIPSQKKKDGIIPTALSTDKSSFLATVMLTDSSEKASSLEIAFRLAQLDVRPKGMVVDATNYALYDYGHPLHAFDADCIEGSLKARDGYNQETLLLLDGTEISLTNKDIVIADNNEALSLAGIMGGSLSAIKSSTKNILLEAAVFNAAAIRNSAQRFNKRTDSSIRFEKHLQSYGALCALRRTLKILIDGQCIDFKKYTACYAGQLPEKTTIHLEHALLTRILGIDIDIDFVRQSLEALGFSAYVLEGENGIIYQVVPPLYRSIKDISIAEDIIEEISRFIGYNTITPLPLNNKTPGFQLSKVNALRAIKKSALENLKAHEVINYGIIEKEWLDEIGYEPDLSLSVLGSEQNKILIDTLIPALSKRIKSESDSGVNTVSFFEISAVWNNRLFNEEIDTIKEDQMFAYIALDQHAKDFYTCREKIDLFFKSLEITPTYEKIASDKKSFLSDISTNIFYNKTFLGYAGFIDPKYSYKIIGKAGLLFVAELHIENLIKSINSIKRSFAPSFSFDISVMIPFKKEATNVINEIVTENNQIKNIKIIDWFDKKEWADNRSITFRFSIENKSAIDENLLQVKEYFLSKGYIIR